jgi:hypothetical protein
MRIVCFVLSVLCLLGSGAWLVIGTVNIGSSSSSRPTSSSFGMAHEVVGTSPNLSDFGVASTLAGVFALAAVAWMIGAVAFAPNQAAPTASAAQQWQPQQYPAQPQYPQQSQQHQSQQGQ